MKPSKTIILLFFLFIQFPVFSQTDSLKTSSLDKIIETAFSNNGLLQNNKLDIENAVLQQKGAFSVPKTNILLQYGNVQSSYNRDIMVNINQNFNPIGSISANKKAFQAQEKSAEANLNYQKNILKNQISQLYYKFVFLTQKNLLLQKQDSLWQTVEKIIKVQTGAGQTNKMELLTAQNQRLQLVNLKIMNENNLKMIFHDLQKLAQNELSFLETTNLFFDYEALFLNTSISDLALSDSENSMFTYFESQINLAQKQVVVERSKAMPELNLGYSSPSFDGEIGIYNFFHAGFAVPLVWREYNSKIQAAKIKEVQAQNELAYQKNAISEEKKAVLMKLQNIKTILESYQKQQLPQAEELIFLAKIRYKAGEISVLQLVQIQQQTLQTSLSYLETIENFNSTLAMWEFLNN
ncbi:TolC family protein [Bernardetia litoralis]|uniref:TolC family protein n=1 Tax=Bernardetia litoralis TaxID=999 RepID=UPI00030F60F5|nr:TolC family protein [Bernardetia litoralis]